VQRTTNKKSYKNNICAPLENLEIFTQNILKGNVVSMARHIEASQ
jgi:hypothetical protein